MSSKLDFILTEARRLLPIAINRAGSFYQEHLRKTEFSAMVPAMIGQGAYELTWSIDSDASAQNSIIAGFGLAWIACAYKGLEKWSWTKDWACLAFYPIAMAII